jgi:hypothetical protein
MVAQVLPLPLSDGSPDFADQVTALLDDFPNMRLAIYPEPHRFGVAAPWRSGTPSPGRRAAGSHGADLGILVTKGRMQTADGLTKRCRRYIDGIRAHHQSEILPGAPAVMPISYVK